MIMDVELADLVNPVRELAAQAGQRIMEIYASEFTVSEKNDRTPLTEADLAAHRCLLQGLTKLTPDIPILSEEACEIELAERSRWSWLWLVDPLDGTKEFIKRSDQFSINIALVFQHQAVFGLIMNPVNGECYYAYQQGGAFKQCPRQLPQRIRTRRLGHQPVRVTTSNRSYQGRPLQTYLEYIGRHQYLAMGSALKACLIAEGAVDLYPRFGPTAEWDTAAAQVIIEQAGGCMTDTFMQPLRYNARPTLINPDFFAFGDPSKDWSQYLPRRKPRV